ncbi:visual pigment-like receptor peropsin isoform X2 [Rhinoraja longicauda]
MEDALENIPRNNISSSTNSTELEPKSAFVQWEHNIVAAYLITAGILSLLSNIIVLIMFVKFKEFRTATNAIIVNLAFTDIGVSAIGYPMSAASDLHGSWKFGYSGCQAYAALNIFFGMASIGLLTVVAIDRYLTISKPDLVNFVVPLSIMFFCYYNVSKTMKRVAQHSGMENVTLDWSDQLDVTKMSVVMIVMFLVAWSPYSIICLWASFGDPKLITPAMAIIAPLFAKSSTFYNPCIYVVANKKFRRAIIAMIRCQTQQDLTISHTLPMTTSRTPLAE